MWPVPISTDASGSGVTAPNGRGRYRPRPFSGERNTSRLLDDQRSDHARFLVTRHCTVVLIGAGRAGIERHRAGLAARNLTRVDAQVVDRKRVTTDTAVRQVDGDFGVGGHADFGRLERDVDQLDIDRRGRRARSALGRRLRDGRSSGCSR